jgi:hypothetical protein
MVRAVSDTPEPRIRWRLGLGVVSAATVCALLFALVRLASVSQPPSAPPAPLISAEGVRQFVGREVSEQVLWHLRRSFFTPPSAHRSPGSAHRLA